MKKFRPIQIKEYTPLTEPEMKNIFGGSGESGDKPKTPTPCTVTYWGSGGKHLGTLTGECDTISGTLESGPGATIPVSGVACKTYGNASFTEKVERIIDSCVGSK